MKYETNVTDNHGDWYDGRHDVPCEGPNPIAVFESILGWCRAHTILPETISVTPPWKTERDG